MVDKSLFIITSPFQALCVKEAIKHFEIAKYSIVIITTTNDNRIEQTKNTLSYLDLKYECHLAGTSSFKEIKRIGKLIQHDNKYSNVFVGDCCDIWLVSLALFVIRFNGKLMYIDDGASTISFLDGTVNNALYRAKRGFLTFLGLIITFQKPSFFTVFNTKQRGLYIIVHNELTVFKDYSKNEQKGLYIIGTNIDAYCKEYNLSCREYISSFTSIIDDLLKNYDEECFYIEHGRCKNNEIREVCQVKGINLMRPNVPIEFYFIQNNLEPKVIVGFDSTALFTLKALFNRCACKNIQLKKASNKKHPFQEAYKNKLYEIGISTDTLYINK